MKRTLQLVLGAICIWISFALSGLVALETHQNWNQPLSGVQWVGECAKSKWKLESCRNIAQRDNEEGVGAQVLLGTAFLYGLGDVDQELQKALKWFVGAAERNFVPASNFLGTAYFDGWGVRKNYDEALHWFTAAAEKGYAPSQNNLGVMYLDGLGVDQSYDEAERLFSDAAEQHYAPAQNNLGAMHLGGLGVDQSYDEAERLFSEAAEQHYAPAQNNLGAMYLDGLGVDQSYDEAVRLFSEAAEQGYVPAMFNLGIQSFLGKGAEQDYGRAASLFAQAAERGHPEAQFNLAVMYAQGRGIPRNLEDSYVWFELASAAGILDAAKGRDAVKVLITPEEFENAKLRVGLLSDLFEGARVQEPLKLHEQEISAPELYKFYEAWDGH